MSMKHILTLPRSTASSFILPHSVHCSLIFLSIVFLPLLAQSKTDRAMDLDPYHQHIVQEFKAKVLHHMGWSAPPRGYNTSRHSLHGKLIREFFRRRLRSNGHIGSLDVKDRHGNQDDGYMEGLKTVVFPSTDHELWVQVQPAKTPAMTSDITVVKFSTNFQQPEIPYHYLLVRSAILRMSIYRQKRKLHSKDSHAINVNIYLLRSPDQLSGDNTTQTLIYSRTVKSPKFRTIEIAIEPQFLSHIVDSDDHTVTLGITVEAESSVNINSEGRHVFAKPFKQNIATAPQKEQVRISEASLQVTTLNKDVSKIRVKRQGHVSLDCTDNVCCRHSIYVDFADIGWNDWVLYPAGFTAYYCKGGCPDRYRVASSFTGIKSILHDRIPELVPAPVCAPTDYNPLVMIIFDGDVKDVSYPGMLVTGCRCY